MSLQLINQFYTRVDRVVQYGGSNKETAVRNEFYQLINQYCEKKNLILVPELDIRLKTGKTITPDGTVKNALRLDFGYWESKANVDLEHEIEEKIRKGYPLSNTIFEDSKRIILYQDGQRRYVADMRKAEDLDKTLHEFISFEPREVTEFNKAVEFFKQDIPHIVKGLREMIDHQETHGMTQSHAMSNNAVSNDFIKNRKAFLELCQESINPNITVGDVNEMLIQHILTEEIFLAIFSDAQFLRENNIARELYKMEETFFTGKTKYDTLQGIKHYYDAIKAAAAPIADHHEKQTFLKIIYENFYKAYNPKGADRLGIVYTPSEIIKFMIEGTDYLLEKHFGKTLASKNVEILDPATGTGTFITDLIEYLPKQSLQHKFLHELHANEIAILPYYIANLNIEYTYRQKMGDYQPFPNICFVDTLENTDSLQNRRDKAKQIGLSFNFSPENAERIKRQNAKKISVIIGNPPYNAKQENYNYQNANKAYTEIDKRIKETYVREGTAQNQIVLYDMYVRFFRWATDRLNENGIISFVTNNSFIDSKTFDGFRKMVGEEYNEVYVVNLRGNARTSGELRRKEAGNVFSDEIRVGVAVYFFVRNQQEKGFRVFYKDIGDYVESVQKKEFLRNNRFQNIEFERIIPDAKNNWINQTDNDFDELLPLIDKEVKSGKDEEGKAIFKLFTLGVATHRDSWIYDFSKENLAKKVEYFIDIYQNTLENPNFEDKNKIAWDRELENYRLRGIEKKYEIEKVQKSIFRPFTKKYHYFDKHLNGMLYQWNNILNEKQKNVFLDFRGLAMDKPFSILASDIVFDLQAMPNGQCVPLYVFDPKTGERFENITKWGLEEFQKHYCLNHDSSDSRIDMISSENQDNPINQVNHSSDYITKEAIFHYVYAVLHNPAYRTKYEQNLKRDFPRIPFYEDFERWAAWGKKLIDLHINYEQIEKFPLVRVDRAFAEGGSLTKSAGDVQKALFNEVKEIEPLYKTPLVPRPKLKADKLAGTIELDEKTYLRGIPAEAWEYKLGNRSALEWVLDQYKESKPSDPTIAEKFNTYRFAEYKEQVIDLLQRVCTVSVETMKIIREMEV